MKIKRLKAKNVYSFESLDIEFTNSVVQITGKNLDEKRTEDSINGIGKTNIYNLIIQALYSRDVLKTKKGYLKNMFTKGDFKIELWVDDYVLTYTKSECTLSENGNVILNGRKVITDFFENLIPFELMLPLTYISSSIYFPFFDATPKQQKELITLIFNDLLKVKNAVPHLRESIQEVKNTLRTIDGKREVFEEIIEKELDSQYLSVPELPKLEGLSNKIYELESKIREAKKLEEEKKQLEQVEKPEEVENKEEEYNEVIRRVQKADGIIELEIEKLKKMLRIKDYSVCPTCGAKIEYDEKLEEEQRQYIKKLQKAREELQEKQRELKLHQDKYKKYLNASTLYTESQKKLAYISIADVTEIENEITRLRELDKKQNEEYEKVKQEREKAISHNAYLDAEKKNKENAKVELAQLEEKEKESRTLLQDLELLLEICDKVIIEKQIPKRLELLEKLINIELSNFTSQYKIKLDMNEKIKPKIVKNGKEYPYENCSQGERGRINLALLFAIRCIFEKIEKPVPNFLFIDELLNIIDTGGKELIVTTLQTLDITSMIVCHDYEFDIPQLVLIKKENKTNVQK